MTLYDILGVSQDASQREIKNAWRELVLKVSSHFPFLPFLSLLRALQETSEEAA